MTYLYGVVAITLVSLTLWYVSAWLKTHDRDVVEP